MASQLCASCFLSSIGTIPVSDKSVSHSTIRPTFKSNSYPNINPILVDTLPPTVGKHSNYRFTPEGVVGPPRANTTSSANANFQSTPNTQEIPPVTPQYLTPRTSKPEKYPLAK